MTMLGGSEIVSKDLFFKGGEIRRDSSIDLKIGRMFNELGDDLGKSHTLNPGEMVFVASEDIFRLPADVTGFVSCKTELTHKGVWAITVGIVDPCWVGPISTSLVNFSASPQVLVQGQAFLRVAFFRHEAARGDCAEKDACQETSAYLIRTQQLSVGFKRTFLDKIQIERAAGDQAYRRMRNGALGWSALIALLFTVLQVGSIAVDRFFFTPELVATSSERFESLSRRLDRLETATQGRGAEAAPD